ncbi:tail fiber domain-containing protein [Flavobacteriales bacterium]|nr:tail fiber domain-containing protein [Flavobacteriales bacterium]
MYNGTTFIASGIRAGSFATGTGTAARGVFGLSNTYEGIGVYGTRFNDGGVDDGFGGLFLNDLGYTGAVLNASDRKIKKDIRPIESALDKILTINGVNYQHDLDKYPTMGLGDKTQYGFIAQELEAVIPELVQEKSLPTGGARKASPDATVEENTNETFKMVNYIGVIPVLVEAIKEQQQIIEEMKLEIEALKNDIE